MADEQPEDDEIDIDALIEELQKNLPSEPEKPWFLTPGDKELLRKMKITPE